MVSSAADTLRLVVTEIKAAVLEKDIVHFDETGTRVNGKTL
jgi:hypothetical protein